MRRLFVALAIAIGTLAGISVHAAPIGTTDNFEADTVGTFPTGWLDIGAVNPDPPNPPLPSAVVVNTTDAFGNPTKALSIVDAIADSQGIYRVVPLSSSYTSKADVRIDRYGTPNGSTGTTSDWAMEVGVNKLEGTTDPAGLPSVGVYASTLTQGWRLYVSTTNVFADVDLNVAATVGTWYTVEVDLDINAATARSIITDTATGTVLGDVLTTLTDFGAWDPLVDGQFDIEGFFDGELTVTDVGHLVVVDNIDQTVNPVPEPATIALFGLGLAGLCVMRRRRPD